MSPLYRAGGSVCPPEIPAGPSERLWGRLAEGGKDCAHQCPPPDPQTLQRGKKRLCLLSLAQQPRQTQRTIPRGQQMEPREPQGKGPNTGAVMFLWGQSHIAVPAHPSPTARRMAPLSSWLTGHRDTSSKALFSCRAWTQDFLLPRKPLAQQSPLFRVGAGLEARGGRGVGSTQGPGQCCGLTWQHLGLPCGLPNSRLSSLGSQGHPQKVPPMPSLMRIEAPGWVSSHSP